MNEPDYFILQVHDVYLLAVLIDNALYSFTVYFDDSLVFDFICTILALIVVWFCNNN